jgi:hypothetical protein
LLQKRKHTVFLLRPFSLCSDPARKAPLSPGFTASLIRFHGHCNDYARFRPLDEFFPDFRIARQSPMGPRPETVWRVCTEKRRKSLCRCPPRLLSAGRPREFVIVTRTSLLLNARLRREFFQGTMICGKAASYRSPIKRVCAGAGCISVIGGEMRLCLSCSYSSPLSPPGASQGIKLRLAVPHSMSPGR